MLEVAETNLQNYPLSMVVNELKDVHVEEINGGLMLMPFVEEQTWMALYVKENQDCINITVDASLEAKDLFEKIIDDDDDTVDWNLPKEEMFQLIELDSQAVFKVVEILENFSSINREIFNEKVLIKDIFILVNKFDVPVELVFLGLLKMSKNEAYAFYSAKEEQLYKMFNEFV